MTLNRVMYRRQMVGLHPKILLKKYHHQEEKSQYFSTLFLPPLFQLYPPKILRTCRTGQISLNFHMTFYAADVIIVGDIATETKKQTTLFICSK